jgi:hypothetical protein
VPHFWRHEHTTFSGFIKARERPHIKKRNWDRRTKKTHREKDRDEKKQEQRRSRERTKKEESKKTKQKAEKEERPRIKDHQRESASPLSSFLHL